MATLTVVRGWPGAGKSTAVLERIKRTGEIRVNRDSIRDELFGYRLLEPWQEELVSVAEKAQVEAFLRAGVGVIIDALHLRPKYVTQWAKVAQKYGADFEIWDEFLGVPMEECIRRDAQRDGEARLGEDVIRAMFHRFKNIKPVDLSGLEAPRGEIYVPNTNLLPAYIVDIDGTCTTGPHERSPYEWLKVGQDKPRQAVIDAVWSLYRAGRQIIFCSGRDAVCRVYTMDWLAEQFSASMVLNSSLFMREQGDMRPDNIVKLELFDKYIRNSYNVIAVFDDRNQVVDMWRSIGLQVFQVAEGDF